MPDWNAKKPLGIFHGSDYVPCKIGAGVTGSHWIGIKARNLAERARPDKWFQNAGPFERDGFGKLRCF
jgi:hypothetical protein